MKKTILCAALSLGLMNACFAQTEAATPKSDKGFDQTVGVQLNGLIKQVFNFNNNTSTTPVNPYLLTYSFNSKKSGWGVRAGVGYNYTSTSSDDGITATTSKLNDLAVRVGVDKAYKLSDKWSAGVGLDAVINNNNDNTSNTIKQGDTVTTDTKTTMFSYGGGVMGWLHYHITDKILIGTEASFYFTTGTQKNVVDVTTTTSGGFGGGSFSTTTETTSQPAISQGTFSSPIVFFLMVRF